MDCRADKGGDESLTGESPPDTQIENRTNDNLRVSFDTVAWQKVTETDSRVCFKVGKSSSSSSPDTLDLCENLKLAKKEGERTLKVASVCRLVANITFDAVDVGKKLLENSLRKSAEVDSQYAPHYTFVAENYRTAIETASEKAHEAEGAARVAHIAGGNALKIAKRLSKLTDIELNGTKEINFQVTWATATVKRAKIQTYKTACTALEAMKTFWKELDHIRKMELNFNGDLNGHSRRKLKFINIILILLFILGCLIVALKSFWKIVRDSDTSISVGASLIIGSIIAGATLNSYYSNVESVAQMEKIRKAMIPIENSLHRLDKYFKRSKFLELSDNEEKLKLVKVFPDALHLSNDDWRQFYVRHEK